MVFITWLSAFVVAIILSTRYRGTKGFVLFCGMILIFLSYIKIGVILILGAVLAFVYSIIPFGRNWLQKTCSVGVNWIKKCCFYDAKIKAKVKKIMKLLADTKIDSENFSDAKEVFTLIQALSELDRDVLSAQQLEIIRKKIAELWKLYYKLSPKTEKEEPHRNNVKTPYDVLGISRDATKEEIKRAYIKLCKLYHPDVNHSKDAIIKFREIQEAYDTICSRRK